MERCLLFGSDQDLVSLQSLTSDGVCVEKQTGWAIHVWKLLCSRSFQATTLLCSRLFQTPTLEISSNFRNIAWPISCRGHSWHSSLNILAELPKVWKMKSPTEGLPTDLSDFPSHQVAYAKYLCGVWDRQGGKQRNVAAWFSGDELSRVSGAGKGIISQFQWKLHTIYGVNYKGMLHEK